MPPRPLPKEIWLLRTRCAGHIFNNMDAPPLGEIWLLICHLVNYLFYNMDAPPHLGDLVVYLSSKLLLSL